MAAEVRGAVERAAAAEAAAAERERAEAEAEAEALRKAEEEEKRNLRLRNFQDTWGTEFSSLNKLHSLDKLPAKVEGMANQMTGVVSRVAKLENPGGTPASTRRVVQIGGRTISR